MKEGRRQERKQETVVVLTGERLLIAFSHGYEVPQAGVELLHDGLKREEKKTARWVSQVAGRTPIQTLI